MDLYISLLTAVFGAVLGVFLADFSAYVRLKGKLQNGHDLCGEWITEYQTADEIGSPWIREHMYVDQSWGNLKFRTFENSRNEDIAGHIELFGNGYVIGKWRQTDRQASLHGTLNLHVVHSGKIMFGFWAGSKDTGDKRLGGWVSVRSEEDLSKSKKLLKELTSEFSHEGLC